MRGDVAREFDADLWMALAAILAVFASFLIAVARSLSRRLWWIAGTAWALLATSDAAVLAIRVDTPGTRFGAVAAVAAAALGSLLLGAGRHRMGVTPIGEKKLHPLKAA